MTDDLVERVADMAGDRIEQLAGMLLPASVLDSIARAIIPIVQADERGKVAAWHENQASMNEARSNEVELIKKPFFSAAAVFNRYAASAIAAGAHDTSNNTEPNQ